jgi:uncharacterized damage-inducible protein DinB
MRYLKHLFLDGEFPPRARLLSGLTAEQATRRPEGASHSIYEELWHLVAWQRIVVERDEAAGERWADPSVDFPGEQTVDQRSWDELVAAYLEGARKAVDWGTPPSKLDMEVGPGETMADALQCLAVHNAFHFGKIVALRQVMGAWPPKG